MKNKYLNNKEYKELLLQHGSPLYIYSKKILEDRCNDMYNFKKVLEKDLKNVKVNIHYSLKANNNPAVLKVVKDAGLLVDSMSPLELDICKKVRV